MSDKKQNNEYWELLEIQLPEIKDLNENEKIDYVVKYLIDLDKLVSKMENEFEKLNKETK